MSHGEASQGRPDRRRLRLEEPGDSAGRSRSRETRPGEENASGKKDKKKGRLSPWKMMALTVSMGGSQVGRLHPSSYMADPADCMDSVRPGFSQG